MSSGCNARIRAQAKWGPAFLEHGADGVNGFLVQASVEAMQDPLLAPKRGSAWRLHVTMDRHQAVAL
jgi:hypothetical protein